MLLAIDVGNTEVTLGIFAVDRIRGHWRLTTATARTPDEWAATITLHLVQRGHSTQEIRAIVLGSVAPDVTDSLASGLHTATGIAPVSIGPATPLPITLDVEEPLTVGADRVVNTLAATKVYKRDTIVVDFGTATTFDCITADGRFLGGVIAPGLRTAADHLVMRAAKLPATELIPPDKVIGRRTEDCIRSGVLFGAAESTDGLVRRIKAEWPRPGTPLVVATGGLARLIAPLSDQIDEVAPDLTLVGLRYAAEYVGLHW
jgi:type III pantothenate kinase